MGERKSNQLLAERLNRKLMNKAMLYLMIADNMDGLIAIVNESHDATLANFITIAKFDTTLASHSRFVIVAVTKEAKNLVAKYGGKELPKTDLLWSTLKKNHGEIIYGDKSNLTYLD